jgi:hypothetical protein
MLVSEAINAAGRKLGVVVSGESMTDNQLADGLSALQAMLRSWAAEQINVFASVREEFTLTPGTYEYSLGESAADFDTIRPNKILSGTIVEDDVTHYLDVIGSNKYNQVTLKTVQDTPYYLYPNYTFPNITLYFYPVPSTADTLTLESLKPFTETSSFTATSDTLSFPSHYEEAIIYNLAIRLAPEFSKPISNEVLGIAISSHKRITTLNSGNQTNEAVVIVPAGYRGSYSINSD